MEYKELRIATNDSTYFPAEDTFLVADVIESELDEMDGRADVLDLGCGTGILGMVAARSTKVASVTFADISDDAIKLCEQNIKANVNILAADCCVVKSSLFSNIIGSYDLVIFNAPYLAEGKDDPLSNAWYGGKTGTEISRQFLDEAQDHLKDHGTIILACSSFSDLDGLYESITKSKFLVVRDASIHISFEDILALVIKRQPDAVEE